MSFQEEVAKIRDNVLKMPEYRKPINQLGERIKAGELSKETTTKENTLEL